MNFKRNVLLAGLIAIGSIGFSTAQETKSLQKKTVDKAYIKKSPVTISEGVLTLSTTDTDGKIKTEKVDLSGKTIGEAMSILGEKRGKPYRKYHRKGKENRRDFQGVKSQSKKHSKPSLRKDKK